MLMILLQVDGFLSDIGGVLGLCAGFSICTIAEIVELGMDLSVFLSLAFAKRAKNVFTRNQTPDGQPNMNKRLSTVSLNYQVPDSPPPPVVSERDDF